MAVLTGGNIANIERIKIVTKETTPRTFIFDTATSASFVAVVSAGTEQEMRIKNTVHGLIKTEDLVKGYDLTIDDQKLLMDVFALIDGGTYTPGVPGTDGGKYTGPLAGAPVVRKQFDIFLYTSDRDTDGEALAFHEWFFPACKGKPIEGSFKDGDFATNNYKAASRPPKGEPPITVERIEELPAVA